MAWVRSIVLLAAAPVMLSASPSRAPETGRLEVNIEGLRSAKGALQLCLTASAAHFPDCGDDPAARRLSIPAKRQQARFDDLPRGAYALAIIHDENSNNRLDTVAGIPREGFGFSRNPVVRFGPPRFAQVRFAVGAGATRQAVRMKYFF